MPSEKVLEQKKQIVEKLADMLKNSSAGVIVDYKGINVADDTKLRAKLRDAGVNYSVIKNTLLSFAVKEAGLDELEAVLKGTTALAVSEEDPVSAAKILSEYASKNKKFTIKGGFVDGKVISSDEVNNLAKLPSREVLLSKVLGGFNAPISGFVNLLNANIRGLAIVLNAIAEKKSA